MSNQSNDVEELRREVRYLKGYAIPKGLEMHLDGTGNTCKRTSGARSIQDIRRSSSEELFNR